MKICAQGIVTLALALGPLVCHADSSYRETTQMTGGQLVDSLRNIPFMSKQMKSLTDPVTTTTMVRGNQKAVVSEQSREIYDLDKQEIIHVDMVRKEYSVETFADLRNMMAKMPAAIQQAQAQAAQQQQQPPLPASNLQFNFSVSVNDAGLQQVINGLNARQQILKLSVIVTDPSNPGTSLTYTMTSEIWTTPDVPRQIKEAQDFDVRFAQALMSGMDLSAYMHMRNSGNAAMTQMFAGKPGAAEAFAQMGRELAKIKGTRILEKTSMGGSGTGMAQPQQGSAAASGNAGASTANAGTSAANAGISTANAGTSGGMMARAVSGLGGMWARKKAQQAAAPAPSPTSAPQTSGETTLMEMTTQKSGFSDDPIPASAFEIPAGFKQVPSPLARSLANP